MLDSLLCTLGLGGISSRSHAPAWECLPSGLCPDSRFPHQRMSIAHADTGATRGKAYSGSQWFCRKRVALLIEPAAAPGIESVITFEDCYNHAMHPVNGGGGASRPAFPGRAWERGNSQPRRKFCFDEIGEYSRTVGNK